VVQRGIWCRRWTPILLHSNVGVLHILIGCIRLTTLFYFRLILAVSTEVPLVFASCIMLVLVIRNYLRIRVLPAARAVLSEGNFLCQLSFTVALTIILTYAHTHAAASDTSALTELPSVSTLFPCHSKRRPKMAIPRSSTTWAPVPLYCSLCVRSLPRTILCLQATDTQLCSCNCVCKHLYLPAPYASGDNAGSHQGLIKLLQLDVLFHG
jgi:hypothetical protein